MQTSLYHQELRDADSETASEIILHDGRMLMRHLKPQIFKYISKSVHPARGNQHEMPHTSTLMLIKAAAEKNL